MPPLLNPNLPILLSCFSPSQPERFVKLGIDPPKGVLLFGPPGTGKTLLARAVANRTDACFIRVIGSELVQKYVGEVRKGHLNDIIFGREPRPIIASFPGLPTRPVFGCLQYSKVEGEGLVHFIT